MPNVTLKSVRVHHPVPFDGPSTLTCLYTAGKLELDTETQMILATPKKANAVSKSFLIFPGNVAYAEILDEAAAKAQETQRQAALAQRAEKPKEKAKDDTITYGGKR